MKDKQDLIHILATRHNLPLSKIEKIINFQFKQVAKIMKMGEFEGIRLPYFGKFTVNPKRVEHITKLKDKCKT